MRARVALTSGEPAGIGPELCLAIARTPVACELVCLGDRGLLAERSRQLGWHIAQLLGRRQFDNTDELKRHQAMEAIRASKADEETELWLRRLRDEAYVETKL